jgi:hypothetical protein
MRTLFTDPEWWAESVAKTKRRVVIYTLAHIGFVVAGAVLIATRGLMAGMFPLVFAGVIMPSLLLTALHELLILLGKKGNEVGHSAPDIGRTTQD